MYDCFYFYLPDREALRGSDPLQLDPDRHWMQFGTGVYVWVLQTFLRLRAAGFPVELVEEPPASGSVVVHAEHMNRLLSEAIAPQRLTVACTRSDKKPQLLADIEIVQNASSARAAYQHFIPSWLQPGLVRRDSTRGSSVETVAYVGAEGGLDEDLMNIGWGEQLNRRGLRWDCRTVKFSGSDHMYEGLRWNDYSTTDVVVALRPVERNARRGSTKPAAKLQNAWAAGVPAILGPEIAYRELRRSPLDYIEVTSRDEVLAALDLLRSDPNLYSAMVQNGLERAKEFQPQHLISRWVDVLWRHVAPRALARRHRLAANLRPARALLRTARAHCKDGQLWRVSR